MSSARHDGYVVLLAIAVALISGGPDSLGEDAPGETRCLWHEPRQTRTVDIPAWERQSTSPFGGTRLGGSDRRSFAISPDGNLLATQDAGGWQLELFDLRMGKSLARFGKIEEPVAIAFAPDGKTLVTACWEEHHGGAVELWDVERRERVCALDEGVNFISFPCIAFSSDGKTMALASRPRGGSAVSIHLWEAASGVELRRLGELQSIRAPGRAGVRRSLSRPASEAFGAIGFAPDGRSLAVAVDDRVTLVEIVSGGERDAIARLPPQPASSRGQIDTPSRAVAWLNPPRLLAAGCADGLIRLYDVATHRRLPPLSGHGASVVALRVLPDGQTLLSVGLDNRVCAWDLGAIRRAEFPAPVELTAEAGEELCLALCGEDRLAAHRARLRLAHAGNVAVLLGGKLAAVPQVDRSRVVRLSEAIGSENYNERRRAAAELRQLGELALPALKQAVAAGRNEVLSDFLAQLRSQHPPAERTLSLRAIDVLAEADDEASRRLLAELAKGAPESATTKRALEMLAHAERNLAVAPAKSELDDLWSELAESDPGQAWLAMRALAAHPQAQTFLRERVATAQRRLAEEDDPLRLQRLISELDADEFGTREAASLGLGQFGERIHPALREALARSESPEVKMRIDKLLKSSAVVQPAGPRLQAERGAEVLQLVDSESKP